jgi:hypothetical protein
MKCGDTKSYLASVLARRLWGAALLLPALLAGCQRPSLHTLVDEAFALVYPELSSKLVKEFPPTSSHSTGGAKDAVPYLSYPLQTATIESLMGVSFSHRLRGTSRETRGADIFVTSPAVARVFPKQRLGHKAVGINLLVPADSFLSIEWDSEWAYHEMGLIAGYRLASLRRDGGSQASAAILFSRGIGRSQVELDAFTRAFGEGMRLAKYDAQGSTAAAEALSIFDVDSMNLPGDRLKQTLSALRLAEEKSPRLLIVASGSRLVLETAIHDEGNIDIMADIRGLGPNTATDKLFVAVEENTEALLSAIRQVSRQIEKEEVVPNPIRVKPSLALSRKARRIQTIVDAAFIRGTER